MISRFVPTLTAVLGLLAAAGVRGQEPAGPPPPSSERRQDGPVAHELLPDIGRIGAQVGMRGGLARNPFDTGGGTDVGGYIVLPLARLPGGKLSYEITIDMSRGVSEPLVVTDSVAFVANLAAGASVPDALAGPPAAPFPVRRRVRTDINVLRVSPFALKYTLQSPTRVRLRPYLTAGLDFVVVITKQIPEQDESLQFAGTAPFDDALIGGLIAQAPELAARGTPTGQGNMRVGGHAAAGLELRLSRGLSLNAEYRFLGMSGPNGTLQTVTGGLGFHW